MTTKTKTFCMFNKKGIFGRRVSDSDTKNRFFKYIKKKEANYRMNMRAWLSQLPFPNSATVEIREIAPQEFF